jgi:hypothetical protein
LESYLDGLDHEALATKWGYDGAAISRQRLYRIRRKLEGLRRDARGPHQP